jgi:hypothetical protein
MENPVTKLLALAARYNATLAKSARSRRGVLWSVLYTEQLLEASRIRIAKSRRLLAEKVIKYPLIDPVLEATLPLTSRPTPPLTQASQPTPPLAQAQHRETIAAALCTFLYREGRVNGRFQMPLDDLHEKSGLSVRTIEIGLSVAEHRDWVRRGRSSVALKAAGIHTAKRVVDARDDGRRLVVFVAELDAQADACEHRQPAAHPKVTPTEMHVLQQQANRAPLQKDSGPKGQ